MGTGAAMTALRWYMLSAVTVTDGAVAVAMGQRGLYTLHRRPATGPLGLAVPRGRGVRWWVTITPQRGGRRLLPIGDRHAHREHALRRDAVRFAEEWDRMVKS